MKDLCVFAQLHNDIITPEILEVISEIYQHINNFDIFITIVDEWSKNLIINIAKNQGWLQNIKRIDLFHNRGMDVGAFLWQLEKINIKKGDYLCLLKLHTKSQKEWRDDMIRPFRKNNLGKYIENYKLDKNLGIIGSSNKIFDLEYGENLITRGMELKLFKRMTRNEERQFIGGTIFMIRCDIIVELMNENIKHFIESCYNDMPIGRCEDTLPHSFERFFSYYSNVKGYKLIGE